MVLLARRRRWRTLGKEEGTKSAPRSSAKLSQEVRKFLLKWEKPEDCARPQIPGGRPVSKASCGFLRDVVSSPPQAHLGGLSSGRHSAVGPRGKSHTLRGKTTFSLREEKQAPPGEVGRARP